MSRQIVIQPNGKYAMWSSVASDFIAEDLTQEEYIEYRAKEAYEDKKQEMVDIFNNLKVNVDSGYVKKYEDCLFEIENNK